MKIGNSAIHTSFPGQLAVIVLASAMALPAVAQSSPSTSTPPATAQAAQSAPPPAATMQAPKEGFWGHVNPFARKKWVNDRVTPIKDQLNELDEVNARNARDIKDVDSRAQAGIHHAQSTAEAAGQTASSAGEQAQRAGETAQGAAGHVDRLNQTVGGLDQYRQVSAVELKFNGGQPILTSVARKQLDELAATLTGRMGYVLEIEAHAPASGSVGIQSSQRLAEAVKRYLVTEHEIPVYRLHSLALGNARGTGDEATGPVRSSGVQIRLMENSLAAQGAASPHDATPSTGSERP